MAHWLGPCLTHAALDLVQTLGRQISATHAQPCASPVLCSQACPYVKPNPKEAQHAIDLWWLKRACRGVRWIAARSLVRPCCITDSSHLALERGATIQQRNSTPRHSLQAASHGPPLTLS